MSKGKDAKKAVKKKAEKTLKEKRQEKKDKKLRWIQLLSRTVNQAGWGW